MTAPTFDPEVSFTVFTNPNGLMTKTVTPNGRGGTDKKPAAQMWEGVAETVTKPFSEFGPFLRTLDTSQAIAHGVCGRDRVNVVSAGRFHGQPHTITRSLEYFKFPDGWAVGMLDYDLGEGQEPLTQQQLFDAITEVWPAFRDLPKWVTGSTSSYIFGPSGEPLAGKGRGLHVYFAYLPSRMLPDLRDRLFKRLWLKRHGHIKISRAGNLLVRTIFDASVFSPERLDFCAGAVCIGCEQKLPPPEHFPGNLKDADIPLPPPLTAAEERLYDALVTAAKEQAAPEAEKVAASRKEKEVESLCKERPGISREVAETIVHSRHTGRLETGDIVQFQDGAVTTVEEILADPKQHHARACADPLEPEEGTSRAMLFVNGNGSVVIHSMLHGGLDYFLRGKASGNGQGGQREEWTGKSYSGAETTDDPLERLERWRVTEDYTRSLGEAEFLVDNLIIRGHITVIVAMSNGGKTAIFFRYVAPLIASKGYTVWYCDADSPASEHKAMREIADHHGFKFLNADAAVGLGLAEMKATFAALANSDIDLTKHVFFFDTLKKFADLMSKGGVRDFFILCRKLTGKGATIAHLAHANKYHDGNGNLVPEGVGDVRNDADDLIIFKHVKHPDGGMDVTTIVDNDRYAKVRGIFKPISFHISPDREITLCDKVVDLPDYGQTAAPKATDEEILEAASQILTEVGEPVTQSTLVRNVQDVTGAARDRVRKLIIANAKLEGKDENRRFVYRYGSGHKQEYMLPPRDPQQTEMFDPVDAFRPEPGFAG